jgi:hypothetical protein
VPCRAAEMDLGDDDDDDDDYEVGVNVMVNDPRGNGIGATQISGKSMVIKAASRLSWCP